MLGDGTNGALPTWEENVSSQWVTSGSDIYYNGGNVAVGTNTASHKLTVGGSQSKSGSFENLLSINSNDSANQLRLKFGLYNNFINCLC